MVSITTCELFLYEYNLWENQNLVLDNAGKRELRIAIVACSIRFYEKAGWQFEPRHFHELYEAMEWVQA